MEIDLNTLLNGKASIIKNNKYKSAEAYVTPFLNTLSKFTNDFKIQVKLPDCLSVDAQDNEDVWYSRVWVQAILPDEYAYDNHKQSVSMLYALDTRKPIVKLFKNTVNMACLNMCVFNPEHIQIQELTDRVDYKFLENVMAMTDFTREKLEKLANLYIPKDCMFDQLGTWVDRCITTKFDSNYGKVKLPESLPIAAYKNLFYNKESPYYTESPEICGFDIYNAMTDIISNDKGRDIVNKFEKTYLISQILNV